MSKTWWLQLQYLYGLSMAYFGECNCVYVFWGLLVKMFTLWNTRTMLRHNNTSLSEMSQESSFQFSLYFELLCSWHMTSWNVSDSTLSWKWSSVNVVLVSLATIKSCKGLFFLKAPLCLSTERSSQKRYRLDDCENKSILWTWGI